MLVYKALLQPRSVASGLLALDLRGCKHVSEGGVAMLAECHSMSQLNLSAVSLSDEGYGLHTPTHMSSSHTMTRQYSGQKLEIESKGNGKHCRHTICKSLYHMTIRRAYAHPCETAGGDGFGRVAPIAKL